jgi:hypothetical protein
VVLLLQAQLHTRTRPTGRRLQPCWMPGRRADERPPLLLRAQARLDAAPSPVVAHAARPAQQHRSAADLGLADRPQDAAAWELLSRLQWRAGPATCAPCAPHAEARAVVGDLTGAIDRLRAAQQQSRGATGQDFIEASVIDARLRQISTTRRQLALELRGDNRRVPGPDEPLPPQ